MGYGGKMDLGASYVSNKLKDRTLIKTGALPYTC